MYAKNASNWERDEIMVHKRHAEDKGERDFEREKEELERQEEEFRKQKEEEEEE